MAIKKEYIILFFCFFACLARGQFIKQPIRPYAPLEFPYYTPDWYHTIVDTSFSAPNLNGYNHLRFDIPKFKKYTIDSFLYLIISKINYSYDVGILIQKRSVKTGKLLWEFHENGYVGAVRQSVRHIYKNDKGQLVLIGAIDSIPYTTTTNYAFVGSFSMKMTRRILDDENGSLIYQYIPDKRDTTIAIVHNPISETKYYSKWDNDGDTLIHIKPVRFHSDSMYLLSMRLDTLGRLYMPPDTFRYLSYNNLLSTDIKKTQDNHYIIYELLYPERQIRICKVDMHFKIKSEVYSEYLDSTYDMWMHGLVDNYYLFLMTKSRNLHNYCGYYFIDVNGKLIKYIEDPDNDCGDAFFGGLYRADTSMIVSHVIKSIEPKPFQYVPCYQILRSNPEGKFDIVKRLVNKDSLRYLFPLIIDQYDSKYIVVNYESSFHDFNLNKNEYDIERDWNARALSIMRIDLNDLIPVTSIDVELVSPSVDVVTYPNPTAGVVSLEFAEDFDGEVGIYTSEGKLIRSVPAYKTPYMEISIEEQLPGQYFMIGFDRKSRSAVFSQKIIKL
jgi:hypothetical protein